MPKAVADLRTEALVDSALHAAICWGAERLSALVQHLYFQTVLPLADHRAGEGPRLDFGAPVGSQTVFPAAGKDRADTAGEAAHGQRDRRNCKHQADAFWSVPKALGPEVCAGKGAAPVHFNISHSTGEIQGLSVQLQRSRQGMSHTDDAVRALHSPQKPERPHDIGAEDGKGAVMQCAMEGKALLLDIEVNPLTAKAGLPDLHLKGPPGDL